MTNSSRDNLFSSPLGKVAAFAFDQAVVDVFPDMISRSVPGYETILAHTGELADRFVQPTNPLLRPGLFAGGVDPMAVGQRIEGRGATIYSGG